MAAKTTSNDYPLHEQLKAFLKHSKPTYDPLLVRLVSANPTLITQDGVHHLELFSIGRELKSDPRAARIDANNQNTGLRLQDWCFTMNRIPNSYEYYLDIDAKKYEIVYDCTEITSRQKNTINLTEVPPFKKLIEDESEKLASNDTFPLASSQQNPNSDLQKKTDSGKMEAKDDDAGNRNKSSLRGKKSVTSKLSLTKDTGNDSVLGKNEYNDVPSLRNLSGIGVSGLNGRENMKKLKEIRNSYLLGNSQESITDQLMLRGESRDSQTFPPLNHLLKNDDRERQKKTAQEANAKKKTSKEFDEPVLPQFKPSSEANIAQNGPNLDKLDNHKLSLVSNLTESKPQKKLKVAQTLEDTIQDETNSEELLNYEELLDCLSVERRLINWEELTFNKDVVKYLKSHTDDFNANNHQ